MFQLTSHNIIQFVALIVFAILIPVTANYGRLKENKLFAVFLFASAAGSLTSLLASIQLPYEQLVLWKTLAPLAYTWLVAAYVHFSTTFIPGNTRTAARLGYAWLAGAFLLLILGLATQGLASAGSPAVYYFRQVLNSITLGSDIVLGITAFSLIRSIRGSGNPERRNRVVYLVIGLGFMAALDILWNLLPARSVAIYHLGYTGNAVFMALILLKSRLPDLTVVVKKSLVYTSATVCVTLAFIALLLGLSNVLRFLPPEMGIPTTAVAVVLFSCSYNWLRSALDKVADRLFYGDRYLHRQMLLGFARRVSDFIDIEEIADALLGSLAKAVRARVAALLLVEGDRYATRFVARLTEDKPATLITLRRSSPLIEWLEREGKPLLREVMEGSPDFSGVPPEDREALAASEVELLCPIISKQRLVGILALSRKHPPGHYTCDDVDLATLLANEAAVAIRNAQLYAEAKERGDTDELTGLHNHRYLQELLNQETGRCSQSGEVFSLLLLDLDFFKAYNDIYGHFAGDEILRDTGKLLKTAIRETDIAARYGGDEFAVILPRTSLEEAKNAAERIRRQFELLANRQGVPLSCSIGVAQWGTDGVTREQLIRAVDRALYHAKRDGGNRLWLARDLDSQSGPEAAVGLDSSLEIASIVYALAATVDARDHYTYNHSRNVSRYATEMAGAIGYSREGVERVRAAALLHDIGKLNLPDQLFTKSQELTADDWKMIRRHPDLGARIIKHVFGLRSCLDAVLFHHERFDGKGYPRGLGGKDIPLDARIMAVADTYDALTSERPYRNWKMTEEEAMAELERCAGSQFDPAVVKVLAELRRQSPESQSIPLPLVKGD